jgi:heptosyltransferase-3
MSSDFIDFSTIRRALVIKLRHHGDVLLTSPVFSVLKNHVPHIEIDALVYADTVEMLSGHPAISQLHVIDRRWKKEGRFHALRQEWRLLRVLRSRRYDLLIHLTENSRGAWLSRFLGAPYSVARAYSKKRGRWWRRSFSHTYSVPGKPRHTVETHLDALRVLGMQPGEDQRQLVLVPGIEAERTIDALMREHKLADKGFIHLHPTSRWLFKCWTVEGYAGLIDRLQADGEKIVLTAAPTEAERGFVGRILPLLRKPIIDLTGRLSLKQLAALTARAKLFIGVDSVPMHIAAAMQTPVVVLFGPSGDLEWGPWRVTSQVITSDHPCRPCGMDGCAGSKVSDCLVTIPPEMVYSAARDLLSP